MPITKADFDRVRTLIEREAALLLGDDKMYLVETRMEMLAQSLGISLPALMQRLQAPLGAELKTQVVEAMTTNETWFFRDHHPFDALRMQVLPKLIRARADQRRLYIWCAACSTGQEPSSLAMLLLEHFPELRNWSVNLLATDIDRTVLERARTGRYSDVEVGRGVPAGLLNRYFQRDGYGWVLDPAVRSMITYRQLNLIDAWPTLPYMDLVLMRNVLIYFSNETKRQILTNVQQLLRPDGYLMLGASETTHFINESYESVHYGTSICYRLRTATSQAA